MSSSEFRLSEDLSTSPDPLHQPTPRSPHVLIIGGGVTGLTTAWMLLDRGYRVTVISKEWATYGTARRLTSQVSGALWELPPTQCGGVRAVDQAMNPGDLKTVQNWALESFGVYQNLAVHPELARASGVRMRMCTSFHGYRVADDEATYLKMERAKQISPEGFQWGIELSEKYEANVDGALKDAYEHLAPIIDTDVAMAFLMRLIRSKGAALHTDTIVGDLVDQETYLRSVYRADVVVNATGLARETASDDSVYPLRGAVLRVVNDGSRFPQITSSLMVTAETQPDGTYEDTIAFIVPRNDNILVLGSIEQPHEYELDLTPDSPEIKAMRRRCEDLLPVLKNAKLDPTYPLAQGLRPYRDSRIRLERESRKAQDGEQSRVVHCYGHGGAGWSLAFGSSKACVGIVEDTLRSGKGVTARL
ncbi:FAD dependent oxidoreductase [Aspergillus cavernicola]|uniref:FAD dependent oxidoreductase n=1 Tax=Aspergillus cavernicola TaxID=176166 RepID=A0ABR4IXW7_9EURO